jgi:hypothetical protein
MPAAPPAAHRPFVLALLRLGSRLVLALTLLAVLGGGSNCSWSSSHDDDDGNQRDDDDDDDGGAPSGGGGGIGAPPDLTARLADLDWSAHQAPGRTPSSAEWPDLDPSAYALDQAVPVAGGAGQAEVLRLVNVQGLSLLDTWGPGTYGAAAFSEFGVRVLEANPGRLALPPDAGALVPVGTVFLDDLVLVRWVQVPDLGDDAEHALPGAALTMVFDLASRLIHVENAVEFPAP